MQCDEAVCQGAAILAGVAIGVYAGIDGRGEIVVREKEVIEPDADLGASYAGQMKQYRQLYATLKKFRAANSCAQPGSGKTMIQPTVGFIVYGVHKDGLKDPMGKPFIDAAIVRNSKKALIAAGPKGHCARCDCGHEGRSEGRAQSDEIE